MFFNECIKECAACMTKDMLFNSYKPSDDWFDQECNVNKKHVRNLLRTSRRSLKAEDRHEYSIARREYKKLLERKRKEFNNALLDKLVTVSYTHLTLPTIYSV
eukprot:TRINITY_DN16014_c0_g1_i2.p1 TRINITY_DN16014_c0_g1~~TRINITY_DN16014_c0_g1_i2.p1  ORF type:complete len:103 (+),score=6.85 TRINITY_DN16014_c0_g1_i2:117-425(+)